MRRPSIIKAYEAARSRTGFIPIGHKVNVKPKSSLIERWGLQAGSRQALHLKQLVPFFLKALVLAATVASLGGCSSVIYDVRTSNEVRAGTVRPATLRQMESQNMDRAAPVLIRIYKEERILEVWKQTRTGKFALLNSYPICKFSGTLGPKMAQGDRQAPEGFYAITTDQMNSQSSEYLSFNVGFPNAFDRSLGRTGSFLMVHGGCRSVGCYAMTDYQMEEIYGLVDEAFKAGQDKVQLQAFPFRMTEENLARHAEDPNAPFWQMLKTGSDAFAEGERPPTVAVCDQRYVFNPPFQSNNLDPNAPCPSRTDSAAAAAL